MTPTSCSVDRTSTRTYGSRKNLFQQCVRTAARMTVPWPEQFPAELMFGILKCLPQGDLARACLVNRYWYHIASSPLLWASLDLSNLPWQCRTKLPSTLVMRLRTAASLTLTGRNYLSRPIILDVMTYVSQSLRLTSLSLCSVVELTEDILMDLFINSKGSLRHVDLSLCHHIGSDAIISLTTHHPHLLTLNLSYTSITDDGLLALHSLGRLTDLSLEGCYNLTRASMSEFLQYGLPPRLSRLNLSYLFIVLGEWLATLNSAIKLERLDVRHVDNITKRDVRGFRERWGAKCEVLSTAKLETDDEHGWRQYIDDIIRAEVVY